MRVIQKVSNCHLFLLFCSFLALFSDGLPKAICNFFSIAALSACYQDRTYKDNMPLAFQPWSLEINSNGRCKREHVESCFWTTENIKSLLPQCLWTPNWAGWWLTMRGSMTIQAFFQALFYNRKTVVKTQSWNDLLNSISSCVFFFFVFETPLKDFCSIHLFFLLFGLHAYKSTHKGKLYLSF